MTRELAEKVESEEELKIDYSYSIKLKLSSASYGIKSKRASPKKEVF